MLRDIDSFFGETRRPISKRAISAPRMQTTSIHDRQVGSGVGVEFVDHQGMVWQDQEEQQEFAWLLSEQGRGADRYQLISPVLISREGAIPGSCFRDESSDDVIIVTPEDIENEEHPDPFGMMDFTNVLQLPKPSKAPLILGVHSNSSSHILAFLDTDPYDSSAEKASQKHRPAPLDLNKTPAFAVSQKVIAVQSDLPTAKSTTGLIQRRAVTDPIRSQSKTNKPPQTPFAVPRTAPLPPMPISKIPSHAQYAHSTPPKVDAQAKGKSFFLDEEGTKSTKVAEAKQKTKKAMQSIFGKGRD